MRLIIGGAYQGKVDFAKDTYDLKEEDVFYCSDGDIDFSKPCIADIEKFTYACVQEGIDALEFFKSRKEEWEKSILICKDIFCGVVPIGADLRVWTRTTGKLCQYLSEEAQSVSRIFCGMEQKLK